MNPRTAAPARRPLGLAARTFDGLSPEEAVAHAAHAGFAHVGLVVDAAQWPDDRVRRMRGLAAAHGIGVLDVEAVRLRGDTLDPSVPALLDVAAALGARAVLAIGHAAEPQANVQAFGELCVQAQARGLRAALEFMPFRGVATLDDALAVVRAVHHRAAALVVDNHHLARSGGTVERLAALDAALLSHAQLCDVAMPDPDATLPPESLMAEALEARTLPGRGNLPWQAFVTALPPAVPVSLELIGPVERQRHTGWGAYLDALRRSAEPAFAD